MALAILVVDDSETMRRLIQKTLQLTPIDVDAIHEAATGRQALALLHQHPIDLVLSNISMPDIHGLELLAALQQEAALQQIPIILISATVQPAQSETLLKQGACAQLRKPFSRETLRDLVLKVLGDSHEE